MHEHYLYDGHNEIGTFTHHNALKNLRVLGLNAQDNSPSTIAIEMSDTVYAPLLDLQGNIRRLIDTRTRTLAHSDDFTAFGEECPTSECHGQNPWRYVSKRFDPELSLYYFGNRYYDPALGRWLSTDPAGFADSTNLYQYVFNNPFRYTDPDGKFIQVLIPIAIWGAEILLPTLASWIVPLAIGTAEAAVLYGIGKGVMALNRADANTNPTFTPYQKSEIKRFTKNLEKEKKKKEIRTEPKDLEEQLALDEAKSKPRSQKDEIMGGKINDPKYPRDEWKKVEHTHKKSDGTTIDIHYWENRNTGEKKEFKFKN
jgi:RHS repeat-associated protein